MAQRKGQSRESELGCKWLVQSQWPERRLVPLRISM